MSRRSLLIVLGSVLSGLVVWRVFFVPETREDPHVVRVVELATQFEKAWNGGNLSSVVAMFPESEQARARSEFPLYMAKQGFSAWPKTSIMADPEVLDGRIRVDFVVAGTARTLWTDWERWGEDWKLVAITFD